ncbi:MAG: hypothetical protein AB8Y72_03985, partial [Coxiella-like endosymbiont]
GGLLIFYKAFLVGSSRVYHMELGYIDVFLISNKPVRRSKKQRDLLKLIMKYLQENSLLKFSHD